MPNEINETTEMWRDYREARQEKKRENKKFSTDLLRRHNIPFKSYNGGVHLVIEGKAGPIDFWPSTGLFKHRCNGFKRRGIARLLHDLGIKG